jgi:alpha-tubulin suppressor-like RCC1 family protein
VRVAFEGTFVDVAAGSFHTCGLTAAGEAYCWGQNFQGQLGNGNTGSGADSPIPVRVDFAGSFASLSLGDRHSCGLTTGGEAWCWGDNPYGQVGDGTTVRAPIPVRVQFEGSFESVIAGNFHSCGLTSSGTAYCWGRNDEGRIGNGQAGSNELVPVPVAFEGSFVELTGGGAHTCGITSQGWAYCWGESDSGRLGNGGTADATVPVPVDPPLGLGS